MMTTSTNIENNELQLDHDSGSYIDIFIKYIYNSLKTYEYILFHNSITFSIFLMLILVIVLYLISGTLLRNELYKIKYYLYGLLIIFIAISIHDRCIERTFKNRYYEQNISDLYHKSEL